MGMETTASSESGKKWSRPDSPVLPHPQPIPKEPTPPPQVIHYPPTAQPTNFVLNAANLLGNGVAGAIPALGV